MLLLRRGEIRGMNDFFMKRPLLYRFRMGALSRGGAQPESGSAVQERCMPPTLPFQREMSGIHLQEQIPGNGCV